jgi:hypothetical protein
MFSRARSLFIVLIASSWLILSPRAARADFSVTFGIETTALQQISNDPFALQFSFFLGGSSTDTATISNFNFGTGSAAGNAWTTYGVPVTGDLSSSIVMTPDTSTYFGQVFQQDFNPGSELTFTVTFSSPLNDGDEFSVGILSAPDGATDPSQYSSINTLDPSYNNNFIDVLTYSYQGPIINTYASADPDIAIAAPDYGGPIATPAPSSLCLALSSLPLLMYFMGKKRSLRRQLRVCPI